VQCRRMVDRLDEMLVLLVAERFAVTRKIGNLKAKLGLTAEDKNRGDEQVKRIKGLVERQENLSEGTAPGYPPAHREESSVLPSMRTPSAKIGPPVARWDPSGRSKAGLAGN